MVNSWWTMWLLRLLDWCWISPVSSPLSWRKWSCLLQCPSSSSSFPMTDPYTLQDVLEFQEFYRDRTCNLGHFSMTFYDWPLYLMTRAYSTVVVLVTWCMNNIINNFTNILSHKKNTFWDVAYDFSISYFRIIFISVLYCGSLVHWHWKASIISHLSVVVPSIPFNSLGELLTSPYQVTLLKNSAYQEVFEGTKSGIFREVWETKFKDREKSLKGTTDEMISVISKHDYALYEGYSTMDTIAGWHDCSISDVKFIVNYQDYAFAFPKGSPYRDLFDLTLQKMVESGELKRIKDTYASRPPDCGGSKGRSLGFGTTCFAVAVFLVGIVACLTFWIVEVIKKLLWSSFLLFITFYKTNQNKTLWCISLPKTTCFSIKKNTRHTTGARGGYF